MPVLLETLAPGILVIGAAWILLQSFSAHDSAERIRVTQETIGQALLLTAAPL